MEEEKQIKITKIEDLQSEFDKVFLMDDRGVLPLLCACVIANQMDIDPIWLLLISPPSGGKTELIESLGLVNLRNKPLCYPISDLTVNTFASGQKRQGKETSLLHKMAPGSIMTFKDFTSMISKNRDAQQEIMGQLREIYDQQYVKRTGTGDDITWRGKVGAIAGCTQIIYESNEQFAVMGDRFIMYEMTQPDRIAVLERVIESMSDKTNRFKDKKNKLKEYIKSYLEYCFDNIDNVALEIAKDTKDDLLQVVNFVTMVASGVMVDKKKNTVEFVPTQTMPMRMAKQILGLAQAFILMNKISPGITENMPVAEGNLTVEQVRILYKVAFDTIPIKRRMALKILAKYELGVTTGGLATALGYQTPVVAGWLAQLNALGICSREKNGRSDKWFLNDKFRDVMVRFDHIQVVNKALDSDEEIEDVKASWNSVEKEYASIPFFEKDDFEKTETEAKEDEFVDSITTGEDNEMKM